MILKTSQFSIQENRKDLDNTNHYPKVADLMRDKNETENEEKTVHHRRDLDSLG
tara:strand:- start:431 stop:592 length:162 start_codon:yes stop_codon:yes gene_type:complete